MIDKSAVEALQQAEAIKEASEVVRLALQGDDAAALPDNFSVHDLERFRSTRRRAVGFMSTSVVDSFFEYSKTHQEEGASIFVNPDEMTATTFLNFGKSSTPGHCDNLAQLKLKKTAAYTALIAHATGSRLSQASVSEFFEDWAGMAIFSNEDGTVIESKKAIAAFRKLTIESLQKLEASEQQLGASRSTFESVKASSENGIATTIEFRCRAYEALEARSFMLRLSVITGPEKPAIALRIQNHELHQEEMATELSNIIKEKFADIQVPVLLGSYAKK